MRRIATLAILLILFVGLAGATAWAPTYNTGHMGGDKFPGPVTAFGLGATYSPTDVSGTYNGYGQVAIQTIAAAETSDDDQCWTAVPCNNTTNILLTSTSGTPAFLAQPDVPRNIIVTPSGSATGWLLVTGTDIAGDAITSNLTFAGASVVAGTKAFKTVTRINGHFTQETARTLKVGTGDVLGLNVKLSYNTVLFDFVGATRDTTAPTVAVSSSVLASNTIDTYTAPGGAVTKVWMVI